MCRNSRARPPRRSIEWLDPGLIDHIETLSLVVGFDVTPSWTGGLPGSLPRDRRLVYDGMRDETTAD
jgi:hypothetical protein